VSATVHGKPEWPWVVYATAKHAPAQPLARFPLPWQAHEFIKRLSETPDSWWERLVDRLVGFTGYEVRKEGRL
jgi:hypothetical protein